MLLVGSLYAVEQWRRLTPQSRRSPVVLGAALLGLGVPFLTMRMGPLFPTVLAVAVGLAWTGVAIARAVPPSLWLRRTQTPTREG